MRRCCALLGEGNWNEHRSASDSMLPAHKAEMGNGMPVSRKGRYPFIYVTGALVMEASQILQAYANAGFQRQHGIVDWLFIAALNPAFDALWPLFVVILALVYFGVLPGGVWDL